ncbi:MAG TPA: ATP-binding protein [Stackebrandtia sp.]|uniref:AAA family ATPase n=1 Tax=Stackebrandtia sp. TaxID=2023065 RepID=UPI002D3054C3|nr:ATP-binding protein [Stackebrandtia sp.]HZE37993.1 ATP-binding protein [Stackebrandtia sp.]
MEKPSEIFGRHWEWKLLERFRGSGDHNKLNLGIVSGRRRAGKTFLLTAWCEQVGGLYHSCVQDEGEVAARSRFNATIAEHVGTPTAPTPASWEELLRTALTVAARTTSQGTPLVVIDELPYAIAHSPELPGLLQLIYDQAQRGKAPGGHVVLCGSSLSVMRELLSGNKPLRGRAQVDLRLKPLDFRQAAKLWGIDDPEAALHVHACVGGFPGYRELITQTPHGIGEFDDWVRDTLLSTGLGVFTHTEVEFLLREEPRITDRAAYFDVLGAIANGATSLSKIGAAVGRSKNTVDYLTQVLLSSGYLDTVPDLVRKKSTLAVTDPIIRFDRMITAAHLGQLERHRADEVWRTARPTFKSQIIGPHFEALAREWVELFAPDELDRPEGFGDVGIANLHDHRGRAKHEVDVLALQRKQVTFLGEAKATIHQRGLDDLSRLEAIARLLADQGYQTKGVTFGLFSLSGFTHELVNAARRRGDVELVDIHRLYGQDETPSA